MTVYNTTDLASALIGEDEVATNRKSATRTLRKFLRDDMGEGKAVVGKGGRYALDLKVAELRAMKKRFTAWEVKQEEEKAARAELRTAKVNTVAPIILPTDDEGTEDINDEGDAPDSIDAFSEEGPTDDEIAAMLEDDTDEV